MNRKASGSEPMALALVEQAVHLLRRGSGPVLAEYYLGSLPFVLALLYFWSDMSRNPMAAWYCGPSAAGVALTFIWMKLWQVRYCRSLWCRVQETAPEAWPWKRLLCTLARQAALQATGVVILPFAALIVLPLAWVYAFYQSLSVLDEPRTRELSALVRAAKEQSMLWPGQNHLVLTIMSLFGLFILGNLTLGLMAIPYLLKWLLGIETVFTLSGLHLLNTTFLAVLGALTYLCIDPIVKAVYVLRCFYGRSRRTGDDIRAALRPFVHIVLLVLLVLGCCVSRAAARPAESPDSPQAAAGDRNYVQRLDATIASVLQERRFAWRLPRPPASATKDHPGWIDGTVQWIAAGVKALARPVGRWIQAFMEWLKHKLPHQKFSPPENGPDFRGLIRWIFSILGFGAALALTGWLVRRLLLIRRRRGAPAGTAAAVRGPVDLTDESVTAQDLPLDQWLVLARNLLARNDLRHALRALYFSVLALLADHERVAIAAHKSNLDYAHELARRAHAEPELLAAFAWCVRVFERAWYGMHAVSRPQVDQFMQWQQRMAELVQRSA
jgi:Domain of unknown function (DUF4129)